MPRPYAEPLILLFAAMIVAAVGEFSWLNWLRSGEARFSDFFVAAHARRHRAAKIRPALDADETGVQHAVPRILSNSPIFRRSSEKSETIIGQRYPATLLARLVSLEIAGRR